jgi:hypothetical protein
MQQQSKKRKLEGISGGADVQEAGQRKKKQLDRKSIERIQI